MSELDMLSSLQTLQEQWHDECWVREEHVRDIIVLGITSGRSSDFQYRQAKSWRKAGSRFLLAITQTRDIIAKQQQQLKSITLAEALVVEAFVNDEFYRQVLDSRLVSALETWLERVFPRQQRRLLQQQQAEQDEARKAVQDQMWAMGGLGEPTSCAKQQRQQQKPASCSQCVVL